MDLRCVNCQLDKNDRCNCHYCGYVKKFDNSKNDDTPTCANSKNTFTQSGIQNELTALLDKIALWNDVELNYALRLIRKEFIKRRRNRKYFKRITKKHQSGE